jgi:hypothetical protein
MAIAAIGQFIEDGCVGDFIQKLEVDPFQHICWQAGDFAFTIPLPWRGKRPSGTEGRCRCFTGRVSFESRLLE